MEGIVLAIIGSGMFSGVLATLISTINSNKQKKKENTEKLEVGLRLILLSTLKRDGNDLINKGSISKEDYEAFLASYNAYKALDGDGWADKVLKQVSELPVSIDD
jgi:hypothetical protein